MTDPSDTPHRPLIAVVADDLIWASRLVAAVQQAGATALRLGTDSEVLATLEGMAPEEPDPAENEAEADSEAEADGAPRLVGAIVDLFGHRYDGVEAVRQIHAAGLPVLAVAQHDDLETRKLALDMGARRVYSYNKFFQDGPLLVTRWLIAADGTGEL